MIPNIPIPTRNMSMDEVVKTRLLNNESGMMGSGARLSTGTKRTRSAPAPTKPATTRVAFHASPSPTQERASRSAVTEAVMGAAPKKSIFAPGLRSLCLSTKGNTTRENSPSGRFTKKTHRQEKLSVIQPPKVGPTTLERENTAKKMPWYLALRAGSGKISAMEVKML